MAAYNGGMATFACKCHWCGKEKLYGDDLTLEHLGDTNAKETIVLACRACNAQKLQVVK